MTSNNPEQETFLLIHGAWVSGAAWDEIAEHLRADGHDVHAPTMRGCGPEATGEAMLIDAVDSVVEYITDRDLTEVTLVGYSFGGIVVQQVAARVADRIKRCVFHSALVLRTGESAYDVLPSKIVDFYKAQIADGLIGLPFATMRELFAAELDYPAAVAVYDNHVYPHSESMFAAQVDTSAFDEMAAEGLPLSWVHASDDAALGFGWRSWGRFADRLSGLGITRVVHLPGAGHMAPLTASEATAQAYIAASRD
ncbi:MAG: alpha/beta fold hydrolase [Stackebrandtia sp.]